MKNAGHDESIAKGTFLMVCSGETYSTEVVKGPDLLERMAVAMFGDNWKEDANESELAAYKDELEEPDNWRHDQDFGPFHYETKVGETDHIQFFLLTEPIRGVNA